MCSKLLIEAIDQVPVDQPIDSGDEDSEEEAFHLDEVSSDVQVDEADLESDEMYVQHFQAYMVTNFS